MRSTTCEPAQPRAWNQRSPLAATSWLNRSFSVWLRPTSTCARICYIQQPAPSDIFPHAARHALACRPRGVVNRRKACRASRPCLRRALAARAALFAASAASGRGFM